MHCINQWHPGPSVCGRINPIQAVGWWPDKTTLRILILPWRWSSDQRGKVILWPKATNILYFMSFNFLSSLALLRVRGLNIWKGSIKETSFWHCDTLPSLHLERYVSNDSDCALGPGQAPSKHGGQRGAMWLAEKSDWKVGLGTRHKG